MKQTSPLSFRVDSKLKTAIKKAATADSRSVSSYVVKVLTDHLRKRGYLK